MSWQTLTWRIRSMPEGALDRCRRAPPSCLAACHSSILDSSSLHSSLPQFSGIQNAGNGKRIAFCIPRPRPVARPQRDCRGMELFTRSYRTRQLYAVDSAYPEPYARVRRVHPSVPSGDHCSSVGQAHGLHHIRRDNDLSIPTASCASAEAAMGRRRLPTCTVWLSWPRPPM